MPTMCSARWRSTDSLHSSRMTKKRSKRDIIGALILTFALSVVFRLYLPPTGFAAARMLVRAFRVAWMPALAMEMVCCSMASWMATWSDMSILSNSSMAQMPLSASIRAPASIVKSPVSSSLTTAAVRPAAEEALPEV